MLCDTHTHARIGSISHHRLDIGSIKPDFFIEDGIIATLQRLPVSDSLLPFFTYRSIFTSFQIGKSRFVGGDHTATRTHLDRKVTQSQASFHRQTANSRAGIFHKISGSSAGRHLRHKVKRHVLCCYAFAQCAFHTDTHGLRFCLQDTLGNHHHLHFAGSDTESDSSDSSVRGGMGVAADDCHARQGQGAFGADHMDDTVSFIQHSVVGQAEIGGIPCQRVDLVLRDRVFYRFVLVVCRRVVVRHTIDTFRAKRFQTTCTHTGKGLRAGYFMTVKSVYVKLCGSLFDLRDHVGIPNLVK